MGENAIRLKIKRKRNLLVRANFARLWKNSTKCGIGVYNLCVEVWKLQVVLLDFVVERFAVHAKKLRGFALVVVRFLQRGYDAVAFLCIAV